MAKEDILGKRIEEVEMQAEKFVMIAKKRRELANQKNGKTLAVVAKHQREEEKKNSK